MEWHWHELSSLLHHLPHSVHDLLAQENKTLVDAGIQNFTHTQPEEDQTHRLILPTTLIDTPAIVGIGKNIDPSMDGSRQNLGLLVRDYLHTLPHYSPASKEAEELLEHWRKILLEQPTRIAEAKTSYWHSDEARKFWQDHIQSIQPDHIIYDEHWEHLAGQPTLPDKTLATLKAKQWQDLVIRQRLHHNTKTRESEALGLPRGL